MTCILVDIGNSRLKYAVASFGTRSPISFPCDDALTSNLSRVWAAEPTPDAVLVASVAAPSAVDALNKVACQLGWPQARQVLVDPRLERLTVGYDEPAELGVDRWLAMIAAGYRTHNPFIVIDAGTAITVDAVDTHGYHLGGGIVPGLQAMRSALPGGVGSKPLPSTGEPAFPGTNTADGIQSATLLGLSDLVSGLTKRLAATPNAWPAVFITGGDAQALLPHLSVTAQYQPELVLEGLAHINAWEGD